MPGNQDPGAGGAAPGSTPKWDPIRGILRHFLTFAGGLLVARGTMDPGTANELAGSLFTLIGVLLSLADKHQRGRRAQ